MVEKRLVAHDCHCPGKRLWRAVPSTPPTRAWLRNDPWLEYRNLVDLMHVVIYPGKGKFYGIASAEGGGQA